MNNYLKLSCMTVADLIHHKSFYVMLAIGVLFVLLLRGCYQQDYVVNGQRVDAPTVAWHASLIAFHIIAAAGMFVAILLSLGAFKRDRDDGSTCYILSGPVTRSQYVIAKIIGQWVVSFFFMFILHATILIIAFVNTGGIIPGYLTASLVCSLNILFMIVAVNFLSLVLPVFASAFLSVGIAVISVASDSFFQIIQKTGFSASVSQPSTWRIVWPKAASLQYFATTFIDHSDFTYLGPLHPAFNMVLWTMAFGLILLWKFNREEL